MLYEVITISIILSRGEDGNIELYYSDTGKGTPEDFDFRNTSSLGLKTIFALGEQPHGVVDFGNVLRTEQTFIQLAVLGGRREQLRQRRALALAQSYNFV